MLINYGMGETLVRANPYLDEYTSMPDFYDEKRDGFRVYTRPGEDVYDYETGGSSTSSAKSRYLIEPFYQEPSHFFDDAYKELQEEYRIAITTFFDNLSLANYLE
jgi:hypothetical protein